MCGVIGDEDHVMDHGYSSDEQISIFNQLTPHAQYCIDLGGPIEDGVIDHDNPKHSPQAFEGSELSVCTYCEQTALRFIIAYSI
jgi:hypothetical protein